ncbi:MAG: hypothetical protein JXR33_05445 [Coriobacteriia bacterium]|nr:hypothetical protein [Coriobacteriia bacterium]
MKRTVKLLAVAMVALLMLPAVGASASTGTETEPSGVVVIVLAPYLTWQDVLGGTMPETSELAREGAIGNLNTCASARFTSTVTQTHAALTISASSSSASDASAPAAYSVTEHYEVGDAADAYDRFMGRNPGDSAVVFLGLPRIQRANESQTLDTQIGALGQAIHDAGGATAALGNSDYGYEVRQTWQSRPAALVAMDSEGLVDYGDVSAKLLMSDPDAPYGVSTDVEVMRFAFASAVRGVATDGGPGLVVVDPGDAERAQRFATDVADDVAVEHRVKANVKTDQIVGMVRDNLPADATLIVLSQIPATPESGPVGFAPLIVSGDGWKGVITTPSTHRVGITPELDIAPTVLAELGIARSVAMLGNAISSDGSSLSLDERVTELESLNTMAVAVDTVRLTVTNTYIGITIALLLVGTFFMLRIKRRRPAWAHKVFSLLRNGLLFMLCVPVSATLMYLVVPRPDSPSLVLLLLVGVSAVLWLAAIVVARRFGPGFAAGAVGLVTAFVLIVDQLLGAPLSFSGLFSYSPLWGARYYGIGNEGASILVGGGLVGVALMFDHFREARWVTPVKQWVLPVFALLVVAVTAAPFWGANVGVAAWGFAAFGIAWLQMNGHKVTWKMALLGVLSVVVIVGLFSVYDLSAAGDGGQTHLGRAWESAEEGGVSALWTIVARKAETNMRVLRASNWSYLLFAILGFLAYMRWRPHGDFADALNKYPNFGIAMTAALIGSLVGYFTEDSGIVIPALVMLYVAGSILYLMLSDAAAEQGEAA